MHSIRELTELYSKSYRDQRFDREPRGLYEPMEHILSIPGKHIRPLLLLAACQAFDGSLEQAYGPAHAMELFHNFSLVHDDIMDAATLRRGRPTVHQQYGISSGILAGDALFIYAYHYLCAVPAEVLPEVLAVFDRTAIEVIEGQQMDMDFEQRLDVTIDEYLQMIAFKTSVLLACSLRIGAVVGGASVADQEAIYNFGRTLGLSFQIKDDWLDTFGESSKVGKKPGGDIVQNKKTFLLIILLNSVTKDDRNTLLLLLDEKDEAKKVDGVKALYSKYDVSAKTLSYSEELYQQALASLAAISINDTRKVTLREIAEMVHRREF
jgi:geranylgeranyl diphosphate synthase, type II